MFNSNFQLTPEFIKILEEKGKEMISASTSEETVNIPGTKIKVILIQENTQAQEKYVDDIFNELNIENTTFYVAR